LIGIVMGAANIDDRTDLSKLILEHGRDNYTKKIILHNELPIETLEFKYGKPDSIQVYPELSFSKFIKKTAKISLDIKLRDVTLPIEENTYLGQVTVIEDGKEIFTT